MIEPKEYARRRKRLMRIVGDDAVCIVPAAPERVRNNDAHYAYRQDSDFQYLTGFGEPEALLVLIPGRKRGEQVMFCRVRDPYRETWDGARAGTEGAVERYGMDAAFPIDDIDDILPGMLEGRSRVYYHFGRDVEFDTRLIGWVNRTRALARTGGRAPHEFVALGHILHELRLYKTRTEQRVMTRCAKIAAEAHLRAMRTVQPGMNEHEVEAELLHVFRKHGTVPSYTPIVGGGANGCVLHYVANNALLKDGDLLLIDAGAELDCYASDITRTFPVNGRFTPAQRALYDIVLAAHQAAVAEVRPGRSFIAYHDAAVRVITAGLIKLGLLKGNLRNNIREGTYKRFYMHKTGHWLGLDVHDVGNYRVNGEYRELEPGMVVTVEPGIYIAPDAKGVRAKWRGIGIRIEDDVLVTRSEPEILSSLVPSDPDEIEALMQRAIGTEHA